jgi:hypothetical protein
MGQANLVAKFILQADASDLIATAGQAEAAYAKLGQSIRQGVVAQEVEGLKAAESLGLGLRAMGQGAKDAGVNVAALERLLGSMGIQAGLAREQIKILREGIQALPGAIAAHPLAAAVIATTAALVAGLVMWDRYDTAERAALGTAQSLGNEFNLGREDIAKYGEQIAATAQSSERAGLDMEKAFLSAGLSPKLWSDAAEASRRLANAMGTDVATAARKLGEAMKDPAGAGEELLKSYNALDGAGKQQIDTLVAQGNQLDAAALVLDKIKASQQGVIDTTSTMKHWWEDLGDAIGNAVFNLGKWLEKQGEVIAPVTDFGPANLNRGSIIDQSGKRVSLEGEPQTPDFGTVDITPAANYMSQADRNKASLEALALMQKYGGLQQQLTGFDNDRAQALNELNKNALTSTQYQQVLQVIDLKEAQARKAYRDALLNLNETEKQRQELIKSAIVEGAKMVETSAIEAEWQGKLAAAADGTILAKQQLNDQYQIHKALAPLTIAYDKAEGAQKAILKGDIDAVTASMQKQLTAQHALAAANDVHSAVGALSGNSFGTLDVGALKAQFAEAAKAAAEWREEHIANLKAGNIYTQEAADEIEAAFREKVSKAFTDAVSAIHAGIASLTYHAGAAGLALMYDQDKKAAADWRTKTLLELGTVAGGVEKYGATVDLIFNDMVAKAYDDDLARRTDWAAGVERAFNAMSKDTADWAKTSEDLVKASGAEIEKTFEDAAASGKLSTADLQQFVIKKLFELLWQISGLQGAFNTIFKTLFSGLGNVLGSFGLPGFTAPVGHQGLLIGEPANDNRVVSPLVFANAPRAHQGMRLGADEVPVIAKKGERILSIQETEAYDHLTTQPIVIQLPASAAAGGAPVIHFNVENRHSTAQVEQGPARRNADGSFDIGMIVREIDRHQAEMNHNGGSMLVRSLESTHHIRRGGLG